PGDRHIPRRSRLAAGIVVAIPRNIDHAPARFVGCPIELGHPEVDPGADRCAVSSECGRCVHDAIPERTCRLSVADPRPMDYALLLQAARPFDERSGDPPPGAAAKGLNHSSCSLNFDISMLPETSAASTRRRSTRSAAWVGVQAVVAISAATTKVRRARIMLTPYSTANSRDGCLRSDAVENLSRSRVPRHPLLRVPHQVQGVQSS